MNDIGEIVRLSHSIQRSGLSHEARNSSAFRDWGAKTHPHRRCRIPRWAFQDRHTCLPYKHNAKM